jgi:hypothetical protein
VAAGRQPLICFLLKKKTNIFILFIYIFIRFFFIVLDTCRLPIGYNVAD